MASSMRWGAPPPRGGGGGGGSYHVLGVYILKPIAWLMALVVGLSAGGALLERMGVPVLTSTLLVPGLVWAGQPWRILTWAPLELSPIGLLFGCLLLYFIGPDLLRRWGVRRFFALFFGGAAVVGLITCLIARVLWPRIAAIPYTGLWPVEEALIIAWASLFRDRQILVMFALPMAGGNLIALTVGITVVMAALSGPELFVPHFVAEALALAYVDVIPLRRWTARARLALFQRRYKKRTEKFTRIDRDGPSRWTH